MSEVDTTQALRRATNPYCWGGFTMLGVAAVAPLIALFVPWVPVGESQATWFQRSGSITTIFSLLAATLSIAASRNLHKPGTWGDLYAITVLAEYQPNLNRIEQMSFVLTLIGTIIWGYGDIPFRHG
ncbi:hypothetical protein SOP85_05205 [Pseudomonas sp. YuFO20]|uniref:hypothetical protein n=1 Tax=Pseudomonas sp. YuFO20 TaxID=3095362 RepID=UPI002B24EC89|nr:hypothetical protein [Pseudomonas sp. YuFO20]MEB2514833.1 hypothetical protein [Pseudomonas sp. YuFO20]